MSTLASIGIAFGAFMLVCSVGVFVFFMTASGSAPYDPYDGPARHRLGVDDIQRDAR